MADATRTVGVQLDLPFDLHSEVRDVLDNTDATDYTVLAEMVADRVPRMQLVAALRAALVSVVREAASLQRVQAHAAARRLPAGESVKVAAIRAEVVRLRLRENIWVGGGDNSRKLLGDCTVADLEKAVERRRAQAAHCLLVAEEYELVKDVLAAHPGVLRVRDLPPAVLAELLSRPHAEEPAA